MSLIPPFAFHIYLAVSAQPLWPGGDAARAAKGRGHCRGTAWHRSVSEERLVNTGMKCS